MSGPVSPQLIGLAAALLTALGAASFYVGWYWIGLVKMLAATPLDGIAARLARLRMQDGVRQSWWCYLLPLFSSAALVILAYGLATAHGWGMILLAFTTLAFLFALAVETEARRPRGAVLLAERKGMIWLMLPFADPRPVACRPRHPVRLRRRLLLLGAERRSRRIVGPSGLASA